MVIAGAVAALEVIAVVVDAMENGEFEEVKVGANIRVARVMPCRNDRQLLRIGRECERGVVDVVEGESLGRRDPRRCRVRVVERRDRRVHGFARDIRDLNLEDMHPAVGDVSDSIGQVPLLDYVAGRLSVGGEILDRAVTAALGCPREKRDRDRIGRPDERVDAEQPVGDGNWFAAGCGHHDQLRRCGADLTEKGQHGSIR